MTTATETALTTIENISAMDLFKPGALDPILDRIEAEVREQASHLDISTEEGRKAINSLAYKVGRSKTFIDKQRKALVSDEKKRLAVIDKEGSRAWDKMEALQTEVRKPLTDWEQADEDRIDAHLLALKEIEELSAPPFGSPSEEIGRRLDAVDAYSNRSWDEFQKRFEIAHQEATAILAKLWEQTQQAEKDRAEFERMKAEQVVREQAERDAAMRAEAAASAKAAAEAEAARVAQETAQAEARQRAEIERQRVAAEERAAESERAAARAAAQAVIDQQRAVEAERARAAEEKRAAEEAEAKREANKKHVAKINGEVVNHLIGQCDLAEAQAVRIVTAIAQSKIPHTKISY